MWETILEGRDRKGLVKMADRTKAEPLLDRHVEIYESMTETLIFGKNKFDRMDMAFVSKIFFYELWNTSSCNTDRISKAEN